MATAGGTLVGEITGIGVAPLPLEGSTAGVGVGAFKFTGGLIWAGAAELLGGAAAADWVAMAASVANWDISSESAGAATAGALVETGVGALAMLEAGAGSGVWVGTAT